jgi:hypothetical protein
MADSKEDVASQALARLGEPAISSFNEDTDTAEKVNRLYEPAILGLLSRYDWSFAKTKTSLLVDAAATPVNEWTRGFLMPVLGSDRVGKPIAVFNSATVGTTPLLFGRFELAQKWVFTNETTIIVEYIKRVPEGEWPGYFLQLAVEALASNLALPITENASKEQLHRGIAFGSPTERGRGGLFGQATDADATGDATRGLLDDHDPMASARFGGNY